MKKVLFLIHTLGAGGAEKVLINLVNNLDQSKYDITLMTVVDTGVFEQDIAEGIRYKTIFKLPNRKTLKKNEKSGSLHENYSFIKAIAKKAYTFFWRYVNCTKIYKHFIKEKYDFEIAFLEGICAKIIASSNNDNSIKYSWIHVDILNERKSESFFKNSDDEKKIYEKFNKIVCVSDVVKNSVKQKLGIKEQKLETLYNIIDSKEILNKSLEKIELSKDCLTFVSVGRLSNQKGYDRLIDAATKLKKENAKFKIYIIGEGPEKKNLEDQIEKNNVSDVIYLLGFKKNPYAYMKFADVFICSSRAEGFSTVASEAVVLGKPCIVTDCSGMRELFGKDGEYGLITENSTEGIYDGMKKFINNKEMLTEYAERAKKGAKRFDVNIALETIERNLLDDF